VARKKLSRNAPCPCGSGKKYKKCCWSKGFDWEEDDDGNVFKSVPISGEVAELLNEQRQRFMEEHGREPGPDDLLFPDLPHSEHLEHIMVEEMKAAGIDPAIIHAFEKTGRLVTEANQHLLSDAERAEWDAAIEEYGTRLRQPEKPMEYPMGTVAMYGPDDKRTTKIAAAVFLQDGAEPILMRWVATDVTTNPKIQQAMREFFLQHGVKSVAMSEGNMGCPHEEGEDFPDGEDCPFCPFWKGKQGSGVDLF
jgi:hypothetical protein